MEEVERRRFRSLALGGHVDFILSDLFADY